MELGYFILLTGLGTVGFIRRSLLFLFLAVAIFFILAVVFSSGELVTSTQSTNSTSILRDVNGTIISTETVSGSQKNPVFSSEDMMTVSYIFFAIAIGATFLCVRAFIGYAGWT